MIRLAKKAVVYKDGGRETAGRETAAWVCAELVGYASALVAGG